MNARPGARGLRAIMEDNLLELMYDIPDKKDVSEIVINEDVIDEHKEPVYVYKKEEHGEKSA